MAAQSTTERTLDIRYEADETPPQSVAFGLGLQYALLAVGGVIAVALGGQL